MSYNNTQFFQKDTPGINNPTNGIRISHSKVGLVKNSGMESTATYIFTPRQLALIYASEQAHSEETAEFRLLSLPLEIRRNIYQYHFACIINEDNIYKSRYRLIRAGKNCNIYCLNECQTQILAVNRQLYVEAGEVLYGGTIWHISFNSFGPDTDVTSVSDASLRAFRSRPEFHLIRNITIGVMFLTVLPENDSAIDPSITSWAEYSSKRIARDDTRLRLNRELLKVICEILLEAPNLQTLKLLWHDDLEHGISEKKRDCLGELAPLPERVKCTIFMGVEAAEVHPLRYPVRKSDKRRTPTVKEYAIKAELNQYLSTVRQQFQRSQRESPDSSETASLTAIEQSLV